MVLAAWLSIIFQLHPERDKFYTWNIALVCIIKIFSSKDVFLSFFDESITAARSNNFVRSYCQSNYILYVLYILLTVNS